MKEDELNLQEVATMLDEAYNTSVVVKHFCSDYPEIEEISNITPAVKMIHTKIDKANSMLINTLG